MATSPNFNWPEPDNTDLVKNGALAIRTAVNAIDTSLVDLKGGITGQVLAKASGTDMDFSWVAQDDSNAIQNAIVDAKGDLIAASAADTPARLAVGANNKILMAASGETTGLKWAGEWTTWSPTYPNSSITVGNGTVVARYRQIGNSIEYFWRLTWGSTTSATNFPFVSYPATPAYFTYNNGIATFQDNGVITYIGSPYMDGQGFLLTSITTSATYGYHGTVGPSLPTTWATGDTWVISGSYEAA